MGGSGSGRTATRNVGTEEGRYSLDVRALHRAKALTEGMSSEWGWSRSDGCRASVSLLSAGHALTVSYVANGTPAREVVLLERQACHLGGARTWFRCPRCRNRVARVYFSRARFICRRCARLVYRTQRSDLSERGRRKLSKAYRALGLDPDEAESMEYLTKPKGMHWTTFNRHLRTIELAANMRDAWMVTPSKTLLRLLNRHGAEPETAVPLTLSKPSKPTERT